VDAQYPAAEALGDVHGRHLGGVLAALALLLDDGPFTRQVALGPHPLPAGGGHFLSLPLELTRPVPLPGRLGAVLAQIDADLLFLGHDSLPEDGG
jgi:hypothetical protein